jgi:hypothetical protein
MKLKQIALASIVVVAGSSFAQTTPVANCAAAPTSTTGSAAIAWMEKCKPSLSFVLAGSSALAGTLTNTIKGLFDGNVIEVRDMAGPFGNKASVGAAPAGLNTVKIYYGLGASTKKPMVVYYQNQNGSAAGVSLLMGKKGNVPEAKMIDLSKGAAARCVAGTTTVDCSNDVVDHVADLAVSDVRFSELLAFSTTDGKLSKKEKDLTATTLPMLGFGVAVSKSLYTELQKKQGILAADSSCAHNAAHTSYKAACQPNLTTLQVATLLSKDGNITNLAQLVGVTGDEATALNANILHIARRDEASGTQATSQMFFNGSGCDKSVYTAETSKARKMPAVQPTTGLNVTEYATSSGVTSALGHATNHVIGIIPLSTLAPQTNTGSANFYKTDGTIDKNYRFIKLNGVSPDLSDVSFNADGTRNLGDKVRAQMVSGAWPLQVEAYSYYLTKAKVEKVAIAQILNNSMLDAATNSAGLAYYSAAADQQDRVTKVKKAGGNCSPLITKLN